MVAKALIMFFCSMVLFQTFQTSDAFLASFNGRRAAVEKEVHRNITVENRNMLFAWFFCCSIFGYVVYILNPSLSVSYISVI